MDATPLDTARTGLNGVLADAEPYFAGGEAAEVRLLLDAGEYGVALEHLSSYIVGRKVPLGAAAMDQIQGVARELGLSGDGAVMALARRRPASAPSLARLRLEK